MNDLRYEDALFYAVCGEALFFYGAGFTASATSVAGDCMPVGSGIVDIINNQYDLGVHDLATASEAFAAIYGDSELIEFLQSRFTVSDPLPPIFTDIANVNWKTIYTTNYDNVLETAGRYIGKDYESLTLMSDSKKTKTGANKIFHINGYIKSLDSSVADDIFKLSENSYLSNQFRKSHWAEIFFRDLLSAKAIFIVGYSLYDTDIKEIIYNPILKKKCFIIKRPLTKPVRYEPLSKYGQVLYIGIEQFVCDLKKTEGSIDSKLVLSNISLINFNRVCTNIDSIEHPTDNDVLNFLMKGEINANLFINNILSDKRDSFIIERFEEKYILSNIENYENFIICGEMGSGKTVLSSVLSIKLNLLGYDVYVLNSDVYDYYNEIDYIASLPGKVLIIIDNYTSKIEVLKYISDKRASSLKLILTARKYNHNKVEDDLYYASKILDATKTHEIDITTLDSTDIVQFLNLLDQYGIQTIGTKVLHSESAMDVYIKTKGNSELSSILLEFLDSPQIKNKIHPFFMELNLNEQWLNAVVAIYLLNLLDETSAFLKVVNILDDSSIFRSLDLKSEVINFLIKSEGTTYSCKSSIFALYFFKNFTPALKVVNVLSNIARNCRLFEFENKQDYLNIYKAIYNKIASFAFIQGLMPENGKLSLLVKYYEHLRTIEVERKNPHFWLQFAMVRLAYFGEQNNLILAGQYLQKAFSLASEIQSKKPYRITDIQTQYARFLLLRAIEEKVQDFDGAYNDFLEAKKILTHVINNEPNKREAYRPAKSLEGFVFTFKKDLKVNHLNEIYSLCVFILDKISKAKYSTQDDKTVDYTKVSLESILKKAGKSDLIPN